MAAAGPAAGAQPVGVPRTLGLWSWVATVDHKRIGILYITTSLVFFGIGGIEALLIRIQVAHNNLHVLSPSQYNQIFTMHGMTMIFLFLMLVLIGYADFVVPLEIGARDMALPRLNALGYWLFLFGGLLLYFSFLAGGAHDTGWLSYAPLPEHARQPHPVAAQPAGREARHTDAQPEPQAAGHRRPRRVPRVAQLALSTLT